MPVVTLEQLRSNKTRESLYILIHSKGPYTLTGQSPVVFYAHTIIFFYFSLQRHKIPRRGT